MEEPILPAGNAICHIILNHFFPINHKYSIGSSHQACESGGGSGVDWFYGGVNLPQVCFVYEKL